MDWNAVKQNYGQCGWLKKEDVYRTVCKTSTCIYPKSKVRPPKFVQSITVQSVPGNKVAFWSFPFRKMVVLCPAGNTYGNSVLAWYSGIEWNVVKALIEALRHLHLAIVIRAPYVRSTVVSCPAEAPPSLLTLQRSYWRVQIPSFF